MSVQLWLDLGFDELQARDLEIESLQKMLAEEQKKSTSLKCQYVGDMKREMDRVHRMYQTLCHFSRALRSAACEWIDMGGSWHMDIKHNLERTKEYIEFPLWEYTNPAWRDTEFPSHPRKDGSYV